MAIAIALVVLLLGSVLFHLLSPWYLTPLASNWGAMDSTISITFWVTGFVFVAVNLFLVYAIVRFRYSRHRRSAYEPENKKLEVWLTGLTTIGIAALLAPGLIVWGNFVTVPAEAHEVEAVGQQWHWSFRFPGEDGRLGRFSPHLVSNDNPFGLDPEDPDSQDDVLVSDPRVHLPVDQPVKLLLRSKDVLHNFAVAQFRAKMDLVPGVVSFIWLTPTRTGEFEILCQELCGVGHFAMRGMVVVDEQPDFDSWLAEQPTWSQIASRPPADPDVGAGLYAVCASCHGAQGEGNPALNAPKLAGLDAWYVRRQLENFRTGSRGAHPEDAYGAQMAAMVNTLPDAEAVAHVAAYIESLPDEAVEHTVSGDVGRGERIYRTCGNCHGIDGQGIQAINAPRQAGMSDWYLVTQLRNFREGIRGSHPLDMHGSQMVRMASILADDQAINNVVAYINTLPLPAERESAQALARRSH